MNCWEFKECGREAGGENEKELGRCPAYPDKGKICAELKGTLCVGKVQGMTAIKLEDCAKCDFYKSKHYKGKRKLVQGYGNVQCVAGIIRPTRENAARKARDQQYHTRMRQKDHKTGHRDLTGRRS